MSGSEAEIPAVPKGLRRSGRGLWRTILRDFELDQHESLLLLQACRAADRLDLLANIAEEAPPLIENSKGDWVAHPALVESRQQSLTLARLLATLRLPSGDEADESRPQRRGAARGTYGIRGTV